MNCRRIYSTSRLNCLNANMVVHVHDMRLSQFSGRFGTIQWSKNLHRSRQWPKQRNAWAGVCQYPRNSSSSRPRSNSNSNKCIMLHYRKYTYSLQKISLCDFSFHTWNFVNSVVMMPSIHRMYQMWMLAVALSRTLAWVRQTKIEVRAEWSHRRVHGSHQFVRCRCVNVAAWMHRGLRIRLRYQKMRRTSVEAAVAAAVDAANIVCIHVTWHPFRWNRAARLLSTVVVLGRNPISIHIHM